MEEHPGPRQGEPQVKLSHAEQDDPQKREAIPLRQVEQLKANMDNEQRTVIIRPRRREPPPTVE